MLKYIILEINKRSIYLYFLPEGRKHDAGMLADSGFLQELERHAFSPTGNPMALYGYPAYPLRVHLIVPYRGAGITPQMEDFNNSMSRVCTSVEWLFGDINYFKFVDFKKTSKDIIECSGKNVHCMCHFKECLDLFVWQLHFRIL